MEQKNQPHDRFYKNLLEDIDLARTFLRLYLPQDLQAYIDWDTLGLYDGSLAGGGNKQLYADVVYKAQTKAKKIDVIFILNHERKADEVLPIRLLEYTLGSLKKTIKQKKGKPAFILHLTLYNGKRSPYPFARSVFDYFEEKELVEKLLFRSCQIINPHELSDQELASHEETNVLELFLKYGDDPNLLNWLESNPAIARKLVKNKYIGRALEYVVEVGCHKFEDLLATFSKISKQLEATMLTTAQQLKKQGIQQGMQQGIATRNLEIAQSMLSKHLDRALIAQVTGLSEEALKKLE